MSGNVSRSCILLMTSSQLFLHSNLVPEYKSDLPKYDININYKVCRTGNWGNSEEM